MKKKYYLIGFAVLIIALIGYHYYAAGEAARQIDKAIQQEADKSGHAFTVSYSDINIHPFSGDIKLSDFNLTKSAYTQRASSIFIDLTYFNFLAIYIGGTEFGLKRINQTAATIVEPSLILRPSMREFKTDTLNLQYRGNLYDLIRHSVTRQATEFSHRLSTTAGSFIYRHSDSSPTGISADSIFLQTDLPSESYSFYNDTEQILFKANNISWTPPQVISEKYGFFIRGFGYETNSIPVDSLLFMLTPEEQNNRLKIMNLDLHSELFHAQAIAEVHFDKGKPNTVIFRNGTVNLLEVSQRFENFLQNAEQLFGVSIPRKNENVFRFSGPLTDLQITTVNSR